MDVTGLVSLEHRECAVLPHMHMVRASVRSWFCQCYNILVKLHAKYAMVCVLGYL